MFYPRTQSIISIESKVNLLVLGRRAATAAGPEQVAFDQREVRELSTLAHHD